MIQLKTNSPQETKALAKKDMPLYKDRYTKLRIVVKKKGRSLPVEYF